MITPLIKQFAAAPQRFRLLLIFHAIVIFFALVWLARGATPSSISHQKIVVIPIDGVISNEIGALGHGHTIDSLLEDFKHIREDNSIKAVVLRINSPGGSVGAVQEIYGGIQGLRKKGKVVISSFADVAASGGYYIACAGDAIVVNPGTITGSIGVIMEVPNLNGLLQKVGVSFETIKSGAMKDAGSPLRRMTPEERRYFSEVIQDSYRQFFAAVKDGRKLDEKKLKPLADGRIFSGSMAVANGLADQLGGLEDAIELAKTRAGIKGEPDVEYESRLSPLERFLGIMSKSSIIPIKEAIGTHMRLLYLMP